MRVPFLTRLAAALAIVALAVVVPGFGDDYLVIKRKDGTTQKVPLHSSPEQIDSFHVETDPSAGGPPAMEPPMAPERPSGRQEQPTSQYGPGSQRGERLPAAPSGPPPRPTVTGPRGPSAGPQYGPGPARAPQPPTGREPQAPTAPLRSAAPAVTAADMPGGAGSFVVHVYKLPEGHKALPDYTQMRPIGALSADRINLDPSRGENEPAGLPQDTVNLGLRFVGMFMVAGEGIFQFRLQSKDGVRLHIDDKTILENDGIHAASSKTAYLHLSEGVHVMVLDCFNSAGSPLVKLFVTPPLGQEQLFSIKSGLAGWKEPEKPYDVLWGQVYFPPKGKYPEGPDFGRLGPVGRLVASELNIHGSEGIPGLPGRKDMVGLRYEGFFNVEGAGIFAFRLAADDFARLTIGEHPIVQVTGGGKDPEGKIGWAFLQKGSFPIRLDYFHPSGNPRLELFVTQPAKPEELFSPARPLIGYSTEEKEVPQIPAFVYFLKPDTRKLPNFNKMAPSGMFFTDAIDYPVDRGTSEFPGVPQRKDWLGLRFYVRFTLSDQEAGAYRFRVVCDDAAQLIVGKKRIINVETTGRSGEQAGTATLEPGSHEMFLDYLQTTGPSGIQLFITPPGGEEKVFAFQ